MSGGLRTASPARSLSSAVPAHKIIAPRLCHKLSSFWPPQKCHCRASPERVSLLFPPKIVLSPPALLKIVVTSMSHAGCHCRHKPHMKSSIVSPHHHKGCYAAPSALRKSLSRPQNEVTAFSNVDLVIVIVSRNDIIIHYRCLYNFRGWPAQDREKTHRSG